MRTLESSVNSGGKPELYRFTQGVDLDTELAMTELRVQEAWAEALAQAGLLKSSDFVRIMDAYQELRAQLVNQTFHWRIEDEDVHMNFERFLTERVGELGKRIHYGRSRNDLIATTLKRFTADELNKLEAQLNQLITSLRALASQTIEVILPGTTHMQNGQPLRFAHWVLGYVAGLQRDRKRICAARELTLSEMPLGSGALTGSPLLIDWQWLAIRLEFTAPVQNSVDGVGDRDFLLDAHHVMTSVAVRLSRLAEDFIYWASTNVGIVKLPPQWSTGSSMMPNKRNPDVFELTRAKMGRVIALDQEAKVLVKGLPSSYQSDLHEMKRTFQRARQELDACLPILSETIAAIEVDAERALYFLSIGHVLATEVADALTEGGMAFRDAYQKVAEWIAKADAEGLPVHLWVKQNEAVLGVKLPQIDFETAIEKRRGLGGTARSSVQARLDAR